MLSMLFDPSNHCTHTNKHSFILVTYSKTRDNSALKTALSIHLVFTLEFTLVKY